MAKIIDKLKKFSEEVKQEYREKYLEELEKRKNKGKRGWHGQ